MVSLDAWRSPNADAIQPSYREATNPAAGKRDWRRTVTPSTFGKRHVDVDASAGAVQMPRIEQRTAPSLKQLRWSLFKDHGLLSHERHADLNNMIDQAATELTVRARLFGENPREFLERPQVNVISCPLQAVVHQRHVPQSRTGEGFRRVDLQ